MSDSDGSSQRDDRHHRRSRSCSPVSLGCAGETLAEREERRLAEATVPVGPPAGQPQAAPNDPEPPAQDSVPAGEAAPAAQAAAPAAPPPEEAQDSQGAETAALASRAAAPSTRPARREGPTRARRASPGAATASAEGRESTKYRAHNKPSHTRTSPPKPYPPNAAFSEGRPRPVRPPASKRTPPGITLPQLQRQQDARRVI